jgi:hypothetical protein
MDQRVCTYDEHVRLVDQIVLLRSLVESMAIGLRIEEMPVEEAALLTDILDTI